MPIFFFFVFEGYSYVYHSAVLFMILHLVTSRPDVTLPPPGNDVTERCHVQMQGAWRAVSRWRAWLCIGSSCSTGYICTCSHRNRTARASACPVNTSRPTCHTTPGTSRFFWHLLINWWASSLHQSCHRLLSSNPLAPMLALPGRVTMKYIPWKSPSLYHTVSTVR